MSRPRLHWFWRVGIASVMGTLVAVFVWELLRVWFIRMDMVSRHRPEFLGLLLWVFLTSLSGAVSYALVARASQSDGSETRCRKCGYILRGIPEPRCSECGERI